MTPNLLVSEKEKQRLRNLQDRFDDLFVSESGELGRTSVVKHSISTSGCPIRQRIHRIDYRQLNAAAHQDAYPLPIIDVTLESGR